VSGRVFVVVPAYNEGRVLRATLRALRDAGDYHVVVVDDGSRDNTWQVIRELPVYGLRHPVNLGAGAATQTGITFALERGADYVVLFDADGQHRAADIPVLLEPLVKGEADVALGSRFLRPADRAAVPPLKRLLLRGAVVVEGLMTGVWLSDAHNGFRAMTRRAAEALKLRENRYAFCSEMLCQFRRHRLRLAEQPTHVSYTAYSLAKGQSMWNSVNIVIDVLLGKVFG
jgi:glycosyltransferase involved in cell wall biosynthesis